MINSGPGGERGGDQHALQHATGQLVRVLRELLLRSRDLDLLEKFDGAGGLVGLAGDTAVPDRVAKLRPDGVHGAQRGHRILRDERDVPAANLRQRLGLTQDVGVAELRRTRQHRQVVGKQAEDAHRGGRLAGPGFTDDRDGLAGVDAERHAVDGAHHTVCGDEFDLQVVDS